MPSADAVHVPDAAGLPDMHIWVVKSEVPTFVQSEGPLYAGGPIWRIRLTAPRPSPTTRASQPKR